jgi:hypothetical protein
MRRYALLILILLPTLKFFGQGVKTSLVEGKVSYITLQNIYVKFENAGLVKPGDTIFIQKDISLIPLFIAESVSSTSCVGKPIGSYFPKVSDVVVVKNLQFDKPEIKQFNKNELLNASSPLDSTKISGTNAVQKPEDKPMREQKIRGRLSASSYSSFSNTSDFNQRMRYTFSMTADHISGSRFSTDSYILFTHKTNHWNEVQDNIFNALKIYSLSVNYDVTKSTRVLIGRKINPRIASVGAIDGLQTETSFKNFTFGAVVGSNPDYTDYSFNPKLFEYGAYLSHDFSNKTGQLVNSFAFFQQTNNGNTDRRFAYFQQENSLIKNLNLFLSCEIDLYTLLNGVPANTVSLTSLYLSARYRFSRQLSVFASYDARKNVIYYETFKNYLDQMLEDATRQGYQFRINYNPGKMINSGITGGYRFRSNDINPTLNANAFLTFNQVPWVNASVSLSSNYLKTSYVNGLIYGIRIYRDIIPSKLTSGIYYRLVDYNYPNTNTSSLQHMAEVELSWQISKKFSFSANYDGTLEKSNLYNTVYLNLIKRF